MNLSKSLLVLLALGFCATLMQAKHDEKAKAPKKPLVQVLSLPFEAAAFVVEEVALPVIKLPVSLINHTFGK
jgi:hypothetical protein